MVQLKILSTLNRVVRDLPIRRKLVLSFLILIIFPITLIGLISFYRASELLKNKTQQYTKDILMETGNNIEIKLREAEKLSFQVVSSADIQTALKNANKGFKDEYEKITVEKTIDAQLKSLISSDVDIAAIQIMSNSGFNYYINPASVTFSTSDEELNILDEGNGRIHWFETDPNAQTIAVGRTINSLVGMEKIGYVLIYMKESSIFNIYKKTELFKNGEFFIVSKGGSIVSYKDKNLLGSKSGLPLPGNIFDEIRETFTTANVNGKNTYITFRVIEGTSWKIVSLIPAVQYEREIISLRNWTFFTCISCCMLALIISFWLSESISKPVRKLSSMMLKVGGGNFNVSSSYESKNEMGILSSHFNKMVSQVQQLIQEVYQEQLLKQKAELKSLRMQINPHFLYNTLESINWMARIKGAPEVGRMVKALGDLMRTSISGDDFVSIEEEIKNINNYLTIQKFRYGDRFEVNVDISPEIEYFKIPKLILQPIVENAFVHGIENKVGSGKIEIIGQKEDDKIVFQVNDNGIGMDEEVAAGLLLPDSRRSSNTEGHTHIGLNNVDLRIKMYYGQEYGVFIESRSGCGTNVKIILSIDASLNEI